MVRIQRQRPASAAPAAMRHKELMNRNKPAYKVILEQVTQQKKKLITVGSFHARPPPGYTFIPAGDPQITNRCKQLARLDGAKVFAVSTTRHRHSGLSNAVHRAGYHFPSSVVARACLSLGIELSSLGKVLPRQPNSANHEVSRPSPHSHNPSAPTTNVAKPDQTQAEVDTEARQAIRDLFPKIPNQDLRGIVKHAFELGTARVGVASELSLPRRVQLAVVAHIRHKYTNYDNLLKQVSYQAARAVVEQPSLNKMAAWRGDDDDDEPDTMEEILREVIVIPDDEEDEGIETTSNPADFNQYREGSVEILSSRNIAADVELRPIDYGVRRISGDRVESPETDDAQEVTFLGHGQYVLDRRERNTANRGGAHRQRAWEQARDRFRQPPAANPISHATHENPKALGSDSNSLCQDQYIGNFMHRPEKLQQFQTGDALESVKIPTALRPVVEHTFRHDDMEPINSQVRHRLPTSIRFIPTEAQATIRTSRHGTQQVRSVVSDDRQHSNCVAIPRMEELAMSNYDTKLTTDKRYTLQSQKTSIRSQPSQHAEPILQSIESPTRFRSQENYLSRVAASPLLGQVSRQDILDATSPRLVRIDPDPHLDRQYLKKRRVENPMQQSPNETHLRGSFLVPVNNHDFRDAPTQLSLIARRSDDSKPVIKVGPYATAHPLGTSNQTSQRDTIMYVSNSNRYIPHSTSKVPTSPSFVHTRHPLSHPLSSLPPLQRELNGSRPFVAGSYTLRPASYGSVDPYISLQRDHLHAPRVSALDSERQAVEHVSLVQAESRERPVIRESIQSMPHSTASRDEGSIDRAQDVNTNYEYVIRDRREVVGIDYLQPRPSRPHERSTENMPLLQTSVLPNYRPEQVSARLPMQKLTNDVVQIFPNPRRVYAGPERGPNETGMYVVQGTDHRVPLKHDDRRIIHISQTQEPNSYQEAPATYPPNDPTQSGLQPVGRISNPGSQRFLHQGSVIILD